MARWKKIDSAPKEGQHVMLSIPDGDFTWVAEGYYDEDKKGFWQANTHWTDICDGQVFPSHWQPLPKAAS